MTTKMKLAFPALIASALVAVAALEVRGLDPATRSDKLENCGDANIEPGQDQWPAGDCLEGHDCVICGDMLPLQQIGDDITGSGDKLWDPQDINCFGERLIGRCVPDEWGGTYCDRSLAYADGTCGGFVTTHRGQPVPSPVRDDPVIATQAD